MSATDAVCWALIAWNGTGLVLCGIAHLRDYLERRRKRNALPVPAPGDGHWYGVSVAYRRDHPVRQFDPTEQDPT